MKASPVRQRRESPAPDLGELRAADIDERIRRIAEFVCEELTRTLELPPEHAVDPKQPPHAQGVGSIMALRLKRLCESNLLIDVDVMLILQAESISELAARLALRIGDGPATALDPESVRTDDDERVA
ncbi:acyl carrier protein [Actinopolyspora halophila]|uniref:acyl carrier protein n=1 Tax=Actinopolyspora halophila TaxID=1850 RepID=UPI00037F7290|nr:acyl carrier protein [Actinopolyspora halophila]